MNTANRMHISVYQKSKVGNYYCGDSYFYQESDERFICALADGLGSGEVAKQSADVVMDVIEKNQFASFTEIVKLCNQALVGKRGVVLGLLSLDFREGTYTFSSIGNIGIMTVAADGSKNCNIPSSGYLGVHARPGKVVQGTFLTDTVFVMFSDGVGSRDLAHSFFQKKDVDRITDLFSDYIEEDRPDDTTLVVMKYSQ